MTQIKLITVEEAIRIEGRGVVVRPRIPIDACHGPRSTTVTLRRPDGQEKTATAMFEIPRVNPPPPKPYYLVLVVDVTLDDIPVGTEIFIQ